jgi:hypothetical protein
VRGEALRSLRTAVPRTRRGQEADSERCVLLHTSCQASAPLSRKPTTLAAALGASCSHPHNARPRRRRPPTTAQPGQLRSRRRHPPRRVAQSAPRTVRPLCARVVSRARAPLPFPYPVEKGNFPASSSLSRRLALFISSNPYPSIATKLAWLIAFRARVKDSASSCRPMSLIRFEACAILPTSTRSAESNLIHDGRNEGETCALSVGGRIARKNGLLAG